MASALALRTQIEAALADRIPSALTPARRILRPVMATGIGSVDDVLQGGLPMGALTEMIGAECSGRTALALSFVAQVTRLEKVCAWVDVSDRLSPESASACGVDLARLLWVRCGVARPGSFQPMRQEREKNKCDFSVPQKYFVPRPVKKGLHGGSMGSHPRDEAKGMDVAVGGILGPEFSPARCAEPQRRAPVQHEVFETSMQPQIGLERRIFNSGDGNPWSRIEQALKVTDLLLQAGGFAAIVLDMGSIAPKHVSRIPLATWFRYRAAADRTQASVLLLTQHACSKSSAGLMLRLRSQEAISEGATVLAGFELRVEVVRQRLSEISESLEKVVSIRKPPQREGVARWRSETAWAGRR